MFLTLNHICPNKIHRLAKAWVPLNCCKLINTTLIGQKQEIKERKKKFAYGVKFNRELTLGIQISHAFQR